MKAEWQLSERRACGLVNISTPVLRYHVKTDGNAALKERIASIASQRRCFGYHRIHILLKREGWQINVKRVYRLYRLAGLSVKKRIRKRIGQTERVPLLLPEQPNHAWSMDFVHDGLADGRRIRCLNDQWFSTLYEAQFLIESGRQDYNSNRPHSSLGYVTPDEFAAQQQLFKTSDSTAPCG